MIANGLTMVLGTRRGHRLITSNDNGRVIGPAGVCNQWFVCCRQAFGLAFLICRLRSAKVVWSRYHQMSVLTIEVITSGRCFELFQIISIRQRVVTHRCPMGDK